MIKIILFKSLKTIELSELISAILDMKFIEK